MKSEIKKNRTTHQHTREKRMKRKKEEKYNRDQKKSNTKKEVTMNNSSVGLNGGTTDFTRKVLRLQ